MNLIIQAAGKKDIKEITGLLNDNKLPTTDIKEDAVQLFVGLFNNKIIGTVGLERYNQVGLLRSLAVEEAFKNQKVGTMLMDWLFDFCVNEKINELYLLTTTAEKYFLKLGFQRIDRNTVPDPINKTREFKDICPASGVAMYMRVE